MNDNFVLKNRYGEQKGRQLGIFLTWIDLIAHRFRMGYLLAVSNPFNFENAFLHSYMGIKRFRMRSITTPDGWFYNIDHVYLSLFIEEAEIRFFIKSKLRIKPKVRLCSRTWSWSQFKMRKCTAVRINNILFVNKTQHYMLTMLHCDKKWIFNSLHSFAPRHPCFSALSCSFSFRPLVQRRCAELRKHPRFDWISHAQLLTFQRFSWNRPMQSPFPMQFPS